MNTDDLIDDVQPSKTVIEQVVEEVAAAASAAWPEVPPFLINTDVQVRPQHASSLGWQHHMASGPGGIYRNELGPGYSSLDGQPVQPLGVMLDQPERALPYGDGWELLPPGFPVDGLYDLASRGVMADFWEEAGETKKAKRLRRPSRFWKRLIRRRMVIKRMEYERVAANERAIFAQHLRYQERMAMPMLW